MANSETIQIITFSLAVLGSVLGVINTWKGFDKDRVKIRVSPKHAIPVGATDPNIEFSIDVLNLSTFPITISEVGILYHGTKERGVSVNPLLFDGSSFPRRLETRTSLTAYFYGEALVNAKLRAKCAYAKTDCGVTAKGNSPAFKQLRVFHNSFLM